MRKTSTFLFLIMILLLAACTSAESPDTETADPIAEHQQDEPAEPAEEQELLTAPIKGALAPDFELESVEGKKIALSDFAGKPVVINFWATWCPPCVHEMPIFQKHFSSGEGSFEVVAVNNMEPYFTVRDFANELNLEFSVLLDLGDNVRELYQVQSFPTTYFVTSDGMIQNVHIGGVSESQMIDYLEQLGISE